MEALAANGSAILFYVFAALAVVSAVGVVTMRNPMYGAIALLTSFLCVAVLFLLRHAEFLAIVQIFVYGGGIMVLFLFVIMLINLHRLPEVRKFAGQSPLVVLLSLALLGFFGWFFLQAEFPTQAFSRPEVFRMADGQDLGNSQAVAWSLFTRHLLPFEIASIFLLIAMIGAVVLGRRQ
ncbi:MAG: NADH-quinone oxidoreductase subunit J [Thermoanaerobaculia bacterium]